MGTEPDDATLLEAVARLWAQADPPPADLADGVLARIEAEDLEYELLTLVESDDLAGVRSTSLATATEDEVGAWSLEYVGPRFRVYVRLTRIEDRTRLDGWVVPAHSLTVSLTTENRVLPLRTAVDEHGRFELPDAPPGLSRLTFVDATRTEGHPQVTPPFWI